MSSARHAMPRVRRMTGFGYAVGGTRGQLLIEEMGCLLLQKSYYWYYEYP